MKPDFSKEVKFAIKAALEAGKISKKYLNTEKHIKEKASLNLVTIADVECEKKIKEILGNAFPDYGFLGEESERVEKKGNRYWVVDPIDGTHNFACRIPIFCHSIALVEGKRPILGVVYDPTRKDLYVAEKGKGAYLNNERIFVSEAVLLKDTIVGMGFPYPDPKNAVKTTKTLASVSNLLGKTLGMRRLGSAVIDICYVATGYFGSIFFYELQPWDVAAAMIIVEEAGGKCTDINGKECDVFSVHYAISNGKIHQELLEKLERF